MLIKCICKSCAGHLEFEEDDAGQKIKCPHCGFDTTLYIPGTEQVEAQLATLSRKLRRQRLLLAGVGAVVVVGGLGWCLYHWGMPFIESEFSSADTPFLRLLILFGFCVVAPLMLLWLVLPIFVFFQWRKFVGLLSKIEQHLGALVPPEIPQVVEEPEAAEEAGPSEPETPTESAA